jgi:hypothetical protein
VHAHIQQRAGRWVFVDLVGKGKRIRTVPIPPFDERGLFSFSPPSVRSAE